MQMAPSIDPIPSALATFLFTSLPPNFTVGPSRLCGDRLGLWWVGCAVEAGSLVGRPGDTESASNSNSDSVSHSGDPELTAQTDSTEAPMGKTADQKPSVQSSIWISFACRSSSRAQQNVAVQCECGEVCEGECLRVCLRVCRDIQPGTELLFYDDTVGKQQAPGNATGDTAEEEMMAQEEDPSTEVAKMSIIEVKDAELKDKAKESPHEERQKRNPRKYLSRHHGRKRRVELICPSDRQSEKHAAPLTVDINAAAGGHTGRTESGLPAEAPRGLSAPPTVRCSSRLASKPRHVHCLTIRSKRPPAGPNSPEQTRGKRLNTTEDGAEFSKNKSGDPEAIAASPTGRTPTWHSEVRERRYRCSSCGKKFYQIGHLKKHQFSHTEEKPFSCEECGKNYTSAESFRAHQMSHRGERPFSCPHCEKTYGLKRDLKEHMVLHSGEKPYACEHCGKAFARRPSLRIHRLLHCSRMTYTQPPKMQCSVCPKLLANSGSLRNHMKLHTGEKQHICQHCGKCFSQKGNLECHLRIHSGEKPFACTECDQTFSQKPELRRHMFSHTGGGFLCSYCGKSLRDPHSLRAHERLHTGERPHCCSVCGKGYTLATKLRRHMRSSHQKEKPFSCHCGASYTVRQSLLRHQAQHCSPGGATKEVESVGGCGEEANTEVPSDCGHSKPVRGRPKKRSPLPPDAGRKERGEVRRRRGRRKGEQEQKEVTLQSGETFTGEEVEDPDNVQHTIVYFHTDDLSTPSSAPLLLASEASLPAGSEQELVEVVISEGAEQCIVVHGQQAVGELLILQEEGSRLCSVAQTVEINTV